MKFSKKQQKYILEGMEVLHFYADESAESLMEPRICEVGFEDVLSDFQIAQIIYGAMEYKSAWHPLPKLLDLEISACDYYIPNMWKRIKTDFLSLIPKHCPEIMDVVYFDEKESAKAMPRRIEESEIKNIKLFLNLNNLEGIAIRALQRIKKSKPTYCSIAEITRDIALIGWVAKTVHLEKECAFCPSLVDLETDGKYCREHSQRSPDDWEITPSIQASKYRIGKMARKLADTEGSLIKQVDNSYWSKPTRQRRMLFMLSEHRPTPGSQTLQSIHRDLAICPLVVEKLGGNSIFGLELLELFEKIRSILNPYRLTISTIRDYQTWFTLEARVQPGMRGNGVKASGRMNEAITLAKLGKTKAEIAKTLGVAQSTVSSWVKKNESFASAIASYKNSEIF